MPARPYSDRLGPYKDVALDVATFTVDSAPAREGANSVFRPATIFTAGDYPDKNFSLSPTELLAAASTFASPIDVDLEHRTTPLDGHLGQLVAVEAEPDGSKLHGIVKYPRWLNSILPNPKLSATWDRASKKLVGLALVNQPRIADAALFAAFSADQVVRGKATMDDLEVLMRARFDDDSDDDDDDDDDDDKKKKLPPFIQAAKDAKAKKGKGKKKSSFSTEDRDGMAASGGDTSQSANDDGDDDDDAEEKAKFARKSAMAQVIHDVTTQRGAVCREEPQTATSRGPYGMVRFAKGRTSFQTIHDTSLKLGALCATGARQESVPGAGLTWVYPGLTNDGRRSVPGSTKASHFSSTRGGQQMGKLGRRLAEFLAEIEQDEDATIPGGVEYTGRDRDSGYATQDEATRALREQVAQLADENRKMRQQGIYDRAVAFTDKLIGDGRALPVEREGIIKLHVQAGNDDTFVGTASFSDGQSRVSQLETSLMARPKHLMDVETAGEAFQNAVALFNQMKTKATTTQEGSAMTAERRAHLLSLDSVGKKVLSDERNGASRAS
jgi:hypothetical protein